MAQGQNEWTKRSEVRTVRPDRESNIFPARTDLTQSSFLIFLTKRTCVDQYAFLAGLYAFFRSLSLDPYGPHTGLFFIWLSNDIAR